MASKEVDQTAQGGSEEEGSTQEDAGEEQISDGPADVLLDISEEYSLKELEPYECHCYSGWEEAVRGWGRVDPMSCIFFAERRERKPKHKGADIPYTPDSAAGVAEQHWELRAKPHNYAKKSMLFNQQPGCCGNTAAPTVPPAVSPPPVVLKKPEKEASLPLNQSTKQSVSDKNRPIKPPKPILKPSKVVVPIKTFSFLPPIKGSDQIPRFSDRLCSGRAPTDREPPEETRFQVDKRREARGAPVAHVACAQLHTHSADGTSKHRTCQHNRPVIPNVNVPLHKSYHFVFHT